MQILIPPPPPDDYRTAELSFVSQRYARPVTPREKMSILDENHPAIFSERLIALGLPPHYDELNGIAKELVPVILYHKNYFNSARPYKLAQRANIPFAYDNLRSAQSPSYPSGHATQAYAIAYALADAYPEHTETWLSAAREVAESRVDRGVHVPSDNEAGRTLALKLRDKNARP